MFRYPKLRMKRWKKKTRRLSRGIFLYLHIESEINSDKRSLCQINSNGEKIQQKPQIKHPEQLGFPLVQLILICFNVMRWGIDIPWLLQFVILILGHRPLRMLCMHSGAPKVIFKFIVSVEMLFPFAILHDALFMFT